MADLDRAALIAWAKAQEADHRCVTPAEFDAVEVQYHADMADHFAAIVAVLEWYENRCAWYQQQLERIEALEATMRRTTAYVKDQVRRSKDSDRLDYDRWRC